MNRVYNSTTYNTLLCKVKKESVFALFFILLIKYYSDF